jgi:hypothetical protein
MYSIFITEARERDSMVDNYASNNKTWGGKQVFKRK